MKNNGVEKWTEVVEEGFEGRYMISNFSRVYDTKTEKFVAQVLTGNPSYWYANLSPTQEGFRRKLFRVHRLMMLSWEPIDSPESFVVDHIDINPYNNSLYNLRWVTKRQNTNNSRCTVYVDYKGISTPLSYAVEQELGSNYKTGLISIYSKIVEKGMTFSAAIADYKAYLNGDKEIKITHQHKEHNLKDFCEQYELDYKLSKSRLDYGWKSHEILSGYSDFKGEGYSFYVEEQEKGMWFPNKASLLRYVGTPHSDKIAGDVNEDKLKELYVKHVIHKGREFKHIVINNHQYTYYNINHLLEQIGISRGRFDAVNDVCKDLCQTITECLNTKPSRIRFVELDGVYMSVKDLYTHFGINPKAANNLKSKNRLTIEQTLQRYGVDTNSIEIKEATK
jgi:hypothetical protein